MRKTFVNSLIEKAKKDSSIFVLVGDLGFSVFEEFEQLFPDRFINVGVCEQNMTGVAAGLAYEGYKVITYSIGNFNTLRCLEQIRNDICYHNLNVNIISVGAGFSYGSLGYTHFAIEDMGILRLLPNMKVYSPSTLNEVESITNKIFEDNTPSYMRIGSSSIFLENEKELDGINIIKDGTDILVLATGNVITNVLDAIKEIENMGVSVCLASVYALSNFNTDFIFEKMKSVKKVITIEEHIIGGLYSIICEKFINYNINLKGIYVDNNAYSFADSQKYMRERYNLSKDNIKKVLLY